MTAIQAEESRPLCVDLDGTLTRTDTLYELLMLLVKFRFHMLFMLPFWVLKGKAHLKSKLSEKLSLNPELLPYNQGVLDFLNDAYSKGRKIWLCTGCHQKQAQKIADHLGLFEGVIATTDTENITGSRKAKLLVEKFGDKQFDYIGNHDIDIKVWDHSDKVLVAGEQKFINRMMKKYGEIQAFPVPTPKLKTYIKAIRVHQWVKNALIFVPLCLDFQLATPDMAIKAVLGFFAFSLLASATYIINDLLDLEADRAHHKKKYRAFAAADISIKTAIMMFVVLSISAIAITAVLPTLFWLVALVYLVTTLAYSFHVKSMVILDTCILAGLFTIRVIGGTVVIWAEWSFWLLAFSMFFFLSLAFTKRASELNALIVSGKTSAKGRGYITSDAPLVTAMGVSSGYIGVLVIALYINSDKVKSNYATPEILWLICPLLLYWIGRIWLKTVRGEMNEDPIVFAIKDKISHITALMCALVVISASAFGA